MTASALASSTYSSFLIERLKSFSMFQWTIALSCIYAYEFSQFLLGPILSRVVNLIGSSVWHPVAKSGRLFSSSRKSHYKSVSSKSSKNIEEKESSEGKNDDFRQAMRPKIPTIQTSQDDRKAIKGDKRDIDKLRLFGYNKHRFVSKHFLVRNKLISAEELLEEEKRKATQKRKVLKVDDDDEEERDKEEDDEDEED